LAGVEPLVEHAAQQVRQLGRQLRRVVDRQAVAHDLQVAPQDPPGILMILGAELVGELGDHSLVFWTVRSMSSTVPTDIQASADRSLISSRSLADGDRNPRRWR
jgi:hypothetical protein